MSPTGTMFTSWMLRNDRNVSTSSLPMTSVVRWPSRPSAFSAATASLVQGFSNPKSLTMTSSPSASLAEERGAHRQLDLLAVHLHLVGTGVRAEHHAAADPMGCADGALTSTAGALLAPRLLAAAANLAAGEGVSGALSPGSALRLDDVVHDVHVRLDAEHGLSELGSAGGCALSRP